MKQTREERLEKQRIYQRKVRDSMNPEQKEALAARKRASYQKNNAKRVVSRALYYQENKATMNAQSCAYHKLQRELAKIIKDKDQEYKNLTTIPAIRKVSVIPRDVTTIKDEAAKLGISTAHLRLIQKDKRFNMPEAKLLRIDGVELFCIFAWADWLGVYKEPLAQEGISGSVGKRKGREGITLDSNVMLIINFMQATKHITKHCNAQRVVNNSKQFWARYA